MSRSKWKCQVCFFKTYKLKNKNITIKTYTRSSLILPSMINKSIEIYNGKKYISLLINESMLYYKFGEFIPTRAVFKFTKKNKKK